MVDQMTAQRRSSRDIFCRREGDKDGTEDYYNDSDE